MVSYPCHIHVVHVSYWSFHVIIFQKLFVSPCRICVSVSVLASVCVCVERERERERERADEMLIAFSSR